jgi:hypothetical protein
MRLENVTVPQYGIKDGSVTLGCFFDLEKDKFLVLKWYKIQGTNEDEFFRYSANLQHPITTFPVEGVFVEVD